MKNWPQWTWPTALGTLIAAALFLWHPLVSTAEAPTIAAVPSTAYSGAYVTNSDVKSIVRSGGTTYLGGNFTTIGPRTGRGVPVSSSSGVPQAGFPDVAGGAVYAVASDGSGGWVIGGSFTHVGGVARNRIAHIDSAGNLDTNWNPNADAEVKTLETSGTTIYVGGNFSTIGGATRNRIAAINADPSDQANYGTATTWDPNITGTSVNVIKVLGPNAVTGGDFTAVGGTGRNNMASIQLSDGTPAGWNPAPDGAVNDMAYDATRFRLYVGGAFSNIVTYGATRSRLAIFSTLTGFPVDSNRSLDADVRAIEIEPAGATVYIGGQFTSFDGQTRNRMAALGTTTYNLLGWHPNVNAGTYALGVSGDGKTLYAGGLFTSFASGSARKGIAAINADPLSAGYGEATVWDPSAGGAVWAIALSGSNVFLGGSFASIGVQERNRLAALDSSGQLTSWNPNADAAISALAASSDGNTIYLGGDFTTVNGSTTRNRIAAVSSSSGTATGWNPDSNDTVRALEVSGTTVFAGGDFTTIGGAARGRFSALDASGNALGVNPNANGDVHALKIASGYLAVGGAFTDIGAATRNRLAAFNLDDGSLQSWNPNANATVRALAASSSTIFAGGDFTTIGGQARNRLVAINPISGTPTGVDPAVNGSVFALATSTTSLYIGGTFTSIGGQTRNRLAATNIDATSVLSWDPDVNAVVEALAYSDSSVFAGGLFGAVGTQSNLGFAQFTAAPTSNSAPTISGSAVVGNTLTCSGGSWDDTYATFTYQWLRDGSAISGATSTTYASSDIDIGTAITCQVTATNVGGSTAATSSAITVEAVPSPTPAAPVESNPSSGSTSELKVTDESASPRCLRSKSSKSTSRKKSRNSKSASKARTSRKKSRRSKRVKAKNKVGSKLKIGFNLSEKAEVTISIRKRKGSRRPFKRCPSKKKKGNVAEQPGKYEEVQKITESVDAGANSSSLSLSSKSSKKKSRVKSKHVAKSSTPKAFKYSLEAPDITKGQDEPAQAGKKQPARSKAVKKKRAGKTRIRHRKSKGNRRLARTSFSRSAGAGKNAVDVAGSSSLKNLKPGTYKAYITAKNAAGVESSTKAVKFWVLRR